MKNTARYICQNCGTVYAKWAGKCEACQAWNTLVEEAIDTQAPKALQKARGHKLDFVELSAALEHTERWKSHIDEFDRVCGGGLVPGSVILVGGDPGIGKSTLLLQVMAHLSHSYRVAYISGEEAVDQIRLRAQRLGVAQAPVALAASTNVADIIHVLKSPERPHIVVIDSIQTMYLEGIESAPGTVTQVRACTHELIKAAKKYSVSLMLVGHVTKEGTLAGPRVLEHMVDTVLYFEGERSHHFRILRSVKNRFGATDEIGVFEMQATGLHQVINPSALFLSGLTEEVSGRAVFAGIEGSRPLLVEVQALVTPSSLATPRRAVVGWDHNRLAMVLAVLEARGFVSFAGRDVYLNVVGGFRITEPAVDLAMAAALVSAWADVPLPSTMVFVGELGLSGEIRPVTHLEQRLKETQKLGFTQAMIPTSRQTITVSGLNIQTIPRITHLVDFCDHDSNTKKKNLKNVS
jgi:DNA repair protein RadA/Sms